MTYTKLMADYAAELKYDDLPLEVVEQVKLLTLQTLGVALASYPTGQAQRAIAMTKAQGGKAESTIIGDGTKVPRTEAAFVNGTLADILHWEDCGWTGHPSAGAVPAALAVGEATGASGKDFITSIVAGYEVYQRIAMSVQPSPEYIVKVKSWGLVSWQIYVAVVPAAKLLNLSSEGIEQALGVAIYQANIPMNQHANPPVGKSDVYHYAHGFNARNGVGSAIIAQSGIDGMYGSLDGDGGYWAQVSDQVDWRWYEKGLGKDYLIMETSFKHWPGGQWLQQPLDALDALVKENNIKAEDIAEISINPPTSNAMGYSPDGYVGPLDAQFSAPFCMASYLIDPNPGASWFTEDKLKDPKVLELAGKVKGVGQVTTPYKNFVEFWAGSFPEIVVTVSLNDGREFSRTIRFPKGHPRNRMSLDEFKDRFRLQASVRLEPDRVEKAIDIILNLENVTDMSEVGELLHNTPTS